MGSDRFKIINHIVFDTYYIGCPIQVRKENILLDNANGKLLLQLKIQNTSDKKIIGAYLIASCYDVNDNLIADNININFLALNCSIGEYFGADKPIVLQNNNVYIVIINIKKIVFEDSSTSEKIGLPVKLPELKKIESEWSVAHCDAANNLLKSQTTNFIPVDLGNLWVCTCGQANESDFCISCGCEKKKVFQIISEEILNNEIKQQAEVDKIRMEREKEENRIKQETFLKERIGRKRKNLRIGVFCTVLFIIFFIFVAIRMNSPKQMIISAFKSGDYETAFFNIEKLSDKSSIVSIVRDELLKDNFQNKISSGAFHTIGIKANGDVLSRGFNEFGQCDTHNWSDITNVGTNLYHTVGLKSNGMVIATGCSNVGDNDYGQCNVDNWKNIIAISVGYFNTFGLNKNGTVLAIGKDYGQCDVSDWRNIIEISGNTTYLVGLKSDRTVVASGNNKYGACDIEDWTDIVDVSTGLCHTVGLKSDGRVVAAGCKNTDEYDYGQCNVSDWKDIVAISANYYTTVGLKADGTVVAVGNNDCGQCNVSDWKNIVAISAGYSNTVGLKADGTVVAVGDNTYGQCNLSDWDLW